MTPSAGGSSPARPGRIVIATRNPGKLKEFLAALADIPGPPIEFLSLEQFPGVPEVDETGATYRENARLKAEAAVVATGLPALGDDSGLEVDALGGAPGLLSRRYAGPDGDTRARNEKLLLALTDVPDDRRTARFRCLLALVEPEPVGAGETGILAAPDDPMRPFDNPIPLRITYAEGVVEGTIAREPRGDGGFGYDPLFVVTEGGRTMAELDTTTKNRLSHRGRALARLREMLAGRG
jgi:XTP/dITP diphosphohydrolase